MSARLSNRLTRLLNLVPYFIANPGISAARASAELGVTTAQLMNDLNQLWMCGLPGYGPGDLIDLSFSEDSIEVTFSAGIDRPLRLTSTEATALLIALSSLADMPGMIEKAAAHSAIAKIEAAAGKAASMVRPTERDETGEAEPESSVIAVVRSALRQRTALSIVYYSASRDAVTDRTVDPIGTVLVDNHSYLQAWCRKAEGVRLFRFDRIDAAQQLDEPSRPPADAEADANSFEIFTDDPSLAQALLAVRPDHAWILDYYPMTQTGTDVDGALLVTMRFATLAWMARLTLGFGAGVTVLAPSELRQAVRQQAAEALAEYAALAGETDPVATV